RYGRCAQACLLGRPTAADAGSTRASCTDAVAILCVTLYLGAAAAVLARAFPQAKVVMAPAPGRRHTCALAAERAVLVPAGIGRPLVQRPQEAALLGQNQALFRGQAEIGRPCLVCPQARAVGLVLGEAVEGNQAKGNVVCAFVRQPIALEPATAGRNDPQP